MRAKSHRPSGTLNRRVNVVAAAALIHTGDGRYLMQLRDDRAGVAMRGRWGIFGGLVESGEFVEAAIARELKEELVRVPRRKPRWFSEICYDLTFAKPRPAMHRKVLFELRVSEAEVRAMELREGERMRLWRPEQLHRMSNVVPWDLLAVTMHAQRRAIERAFR